VQFVVAAHEDIEEDDREDDVGAEGAERRDHRSERRDFLCVIEKPYRLFSLRDR
jgi:hypothetical protein